MNQSLRTMGCRGIGDRNMDRTISAWENGLDDTVGTGVDIQKESCFDQVWH